MWFVLRTAVTQSPLHFDQDTVNSFVRISKISGTVPVTIYFLGVCRFSRLAIDRHNKNSNDLAKSTRDRTVGEVELHILLHTTVSLLPWLTLSTWNRHQLPHQPLLYWLGWCWRFLSLILVFYSLTIAAATKWRNTQYEHTAAGHRKMTEMLMRTHICESYCAKEENARWTTEPWRIVIMRWNIETCDATTTVALKHWRFSIVLFRIK